MDRLEQTSREVLLEGLVSGKKDHNLNYDSKLNATFLHHDDKRIEHSIKSRLSNDKNLKKFHNDRAVFHMKIADSIGHLRNHIKVHGE